MCMSAYAPVKISLEACRLICEKGEYVRHFFWVGGFRDERYEIMWDMLFREKRMREGRKEVKGLSDLWIYIFLFIYSLKKTQ